MQTYKMKDLGYKRTPTSKKLRVKMEDGWSWDVPLQIIADDMDEYYRNEAYDSIGSGSEYELTFWASENMNWEDVKPFAIRAEKLSNKIDWTESWINGDKEIVGV